MPEEPGVTEAEAVDLFTGIYSEGLNTLHGTLVGWPGPVVRHAEGAGPVQRTAP
ncbi:hypothetical protein [Streptomyces koyangensis]|uniref:hypothetical protein n=1 Tax=Streptomyces koyangensis TaxID=188770 RepID=UPI003F5117A3